ncbi:Hypothetical predicted protein [Olea europaea subsp. europaea]|uniref:Uncharacterized protein n=1 Tax=Olea europaea subsp. europaea TaxID=158383 RepID=A0A8S0RFE4_OLEEU|nr:Hypothetical predicted protein [Olea europaea subsp. europaea]
MSIDHRNRCSQEIVHENGDLRDEIVKTSTPDKDDNRHCKCVIGRKMMSGSQGTLLLSVDKEGKSSHGRLWMEDAVGSIFPHRRPTIVVAHGVFSKQPLSTASSSGETQVVTVQERHFSIGNIKTQQSKVFASDPSAARVININSQSLGMINQTKDKNKRHIEDATTDPSNEKKKFGALHKPR